MVDVRETLASSGTIKAMRCPALWGSHINLPPKSRTDLCGTIGDNHRDQIAHHSRGHVKGMERIPGAYRAVLFMNLRELGGLPKAALIGLQKLWRVTILLKSKRAVLGNKATMRESCERQPNCPDPLWR